MIVDILELLFRIIKLLISLSMQNIQLRLIFFTKYFIFSIVSTTCLYYAFTYLFTVFTQ